MQRADDATIVVEHSDRKSENEQKSELAKAISISTAKAKPGQAEETNNFKFSSVENWEACENQPFAGHWGKRMDLFPRSQRGSVDERFPDLCSNSNRKEEKPDLTCI